MEVSKRRQHASSIFIYYGFVTLYNLWAWLQNTGRAYHEKYSWHYLENYFWLFLAIHIYIYSWAQAFKVFLFWWRMSLLILMDTVSCRLTIIEKNQTQPSGPDKFVFQVRHSLSVKSGKILNLLKSTKVSWIWIFLFSQSLNKSFSVRAFTNSFSIKLYYFCRYRYKIGSCSVFSSVIHRCLEKCSLIMLC